ncbi:hypothetical protein L207DRAFT_17923 [Hyaloscypha variabilis F]|uniref:2EXR domain-containing protein n=1 Tax=Hyaloscypha variabilis (strain UAMH 11265 / GT02V1 / F) TaxID=1149755 RepID=A0A2J6SDJ4_HYAVF|nr:hypothetical protein L207DRAFT_17923 [Hyaloscypha variabilis F]
MALNPRPWHQNHRPAGLDPPEHDSARPMLSPLQINIFSQHKTLTLCMSNCKNIELVLLYPAEPDVPEWDSLNHFPSSKTDSLGILAPSQSQIENKDKRQDSEPKIEFSMLQEPTADHCPTSLSRDTTPLSPSQQQGIFRFLDLPLELRLKIYTLLLPPRSHKITTQIPHNGFFYNTATIPLHSATSFYPFGTSAPKKPLSGNLTTYKVLNRNFRRDFPEPSIYPHVFRVCRQIKEEAEPVLYGGLNVEWDFGTSIEAVAPFFGDRSEVARQCVRYVKVAREIRDAGGMEGVDYSWEKFCTYINTELLSLRSVDLTIWSSSGSATGFPPSFPSSENDGGLGKGEEERKWREWVFIKKLVEVEGLRKARVTWWGFQGGEKGTQERGQGFDSWLARRMVGDQVVRERMVGEGVVREGVVVLSGRSA